MSTNKHGKYANCHVIIPDYVIGGFCWSVDWDTYAIQEPKDAHLKGMRRRSSKLYRIIMRR